MARISEKYKSRKWWGFVLIATLATLLLLASKISGQIWADTVTMGFGVFAAGNVGEKFSRNKEGREET